GRGDDRPVAGAGRGAGRGAQGEGVRNAAIGMRDFQAGGSPRFGLGSGDGFVAWGAEDFEVLLVVEAAERAVDAEGGNDVVHLDADGVRTAGVALAGGKDAAAFRAGDSQRVLVEARGLVAAV